MRAAVCSVVLALFLPVAAADVSAANTPALSIPSSGSSADRLHALWAQTRPLLIADGAKPMTDAESVARGAELISVWTELETSLALAPEGDDAHAVLKFLGDFYGRAQSRPERRVAIRSETRQNFGMRFEMLDRRLKH